MRSLSVVSGCLAAALIAGAASAQSIEEKAAVCAGCHGEQGKPVQPDIPILWGQPEGYIYLELRDFKSGARKNELMSGIAATLEKPDMLALAKYFSEKTWANLEQKSADAATAKRAEIVSASAQCEGCHLHGYLGDGVVPRLAGQQEGYLLKTMKDFRDGARTNNPWMVSLLKTYTDDDILALSKFLAGL